MLGPPPEGQGFGSAQQNVVGEPPVAQPVGFDPVDVQVSPLTLWLFRTSACTLPAKQPSAAVTAGVRHPVSEYPVSETLQPVALNEQPHALQPRESFRLS
jgi:hypothetical protein